MDQTEYLDIEKSRTGLYSKFCNLRDVQLSWYESEALKNFGIKRLPPLSSEDIIQQILGKSPSDEKRKLKNKTFYIANAVAYLYVIKYLLADEFIERFSKPIDSDENLLIYNYHRIFFELLFDSLILLNEYKQNIEGIDGLYGCGKSKWQQNRAFYDSLRQSIFGQSSFHSFIEVEPDMSISIIRQLIELRVRRAFGVLAWYQPDTDTLEPLPMKLLFEVIGQYKDHVDFSMPFDCLVRIYGWSNIFLHSGIKKYTWKHIFVMNYLKEFALGKPATKDGGWSVNSGIVVKKNVLDEIISELAKKHSKGAEVIIFTPEATVLKE